MNINFDLNSIHKISVVELVSLVNLSGDLRIGFAFSGRGAMGARVHRKLQKNRPVDYRPEVPVVFEYGKKGLLLEISGRIDGIFTGSEPVTIEEIKSTSRNTADIQAGDYPVHWDQAKCYAYIYAVQNHLDNVAVQLTYAGLSSQDEISFNKEFSLQTLAVFFSGIVDAWVNRIRREEVWRKSRNNSIEALAFPFTEYRGGQRSFAEAVYRTIKQEKMLYAKAPTGTGKTAAVLFPAVKALGRGLISKVFFLTARTPGRRIAEITLEEMRGMGLNLKSVTLTAKEKICFQSEPDCSPSECGYASAYYDKLAMALDNCLEEDSFTREKVESLARAHQLCPFELSLDLAVSADCIICDYNYVFDPRVRLRRFFEQGRAPFALLIDEAHNLPDRARNMYSATIEKSEVLKLKRRLKAAFPGLADALQKINLFLLETKRGCLEDDKNALVQKQLPGPLVEAVCLFTGLAETLLIKNPVARSQAHLIDFFFKCQAYLKIADVFDNDYVSYFEIGRGSKVIARLFCCDPSTQLNKALGQCLSAVFFSATLLPINYFKRMITGDSKSYNLSLPSPFPSQNFGIAVHTGISTKYVHRQQSCGRVASLIHQTCLAKPGNYLVYFPSYAYMEQIAGFFQEGVSPFEIIIQQRGMGEEERDAFLHRFTPEPEAPVLGFAVMGGIFGEGIDLAGERLIGVIIVGVGLPQLCLEQDIIKQHFSDIGENGFAYAYQLPGFNRVMQAAGRVIRSETDKGVAVLVDARFGHAQYLNLFPEEWSHFAMATSESELTASLQAFWNRE